MDQFSAVMNDAMLARKEGRNDDALRLLLALFDELACGAVGIEGHYFITMFEWRQLAGQFRPAHEALARARDEQVRRLLDGDDVFGDLSAPRPQSRFRVIVDINETLKDSRATCELFVRLLSILPACAQREAFMALPAVVEAGDFSLAERYLDDPLERLEQLNRLARDLPLFPPYGAAPRLAVELSNYIKCVVLRSTVLHGLGRGAEGAALRKAALDGIASEQLRELGEREIADPGTIIREISAGRDRPA
ncbi:MAG: hypothetical protein V4508_05430 [Pseudomonadota bacterium]